MSKVILALASVGGHNVQLRKLISNLNLPEYEIIYINASPDASFDDKKNISDCSYIIQDVSRDNVYLSLKTIFQIFKIINHTKPSFLITTGALPGLISVLVGRAFGVNTIWVDSIANSKKLSFSGKYASYFSNITITQWPELASDNVQYHGNILE
ncbi:hypothetical protein ACED29_10895 [Shewanella sp. 5S214]|uniref:hypothetical protein n=1 Tax=Shewanella sp. 5S214 TaxID=3229999 RepID=UPI00352FB158